MRHIEAFDGGKMKTKCVHKLCCGLVAIQIGKQDNGMLNKPRKQAEVAIEV